MDHPNYFDFFGIPVGLKVDAALLRKKFLDNSRKYHPDFHTLHSEAAQSEALEMSTVNNQAYKTLSDNDKRLEYVLRISGVLGENGGEDKLPQSFLMEMMEVNEKIMELEFEPSESVYLAVLAEINALNGTLEASVAHILEHWTSGDSREDLLKSKEYFLKKKYLLRVKENLSKFAAAFG